MLATLEKNEKIIQKPKHNKVITQSYINLIEDKLRIIFQDELEKDEPIFLHISDNIISKIAMFISGATSRAASIGIAGETASGKSTVAFDMIDCIKDFEAKYRLHHTIARINTDDYYYDRSELVNEYGSFGEFIKNYDLDIPEALELELMNIHIQNLLKGKSVYLPKYDMSGTAIRHDNVTLTVPSKIIISEGLFTLTEKIHSVFDLKIYVDIDQKIQKERFFKRADERNLGAGAQYMFDNASEKARVYIRPCKQKADIILSGAANRKQYKCFLNNVLNLIEEVHFKNRY